MDSKRNSPQFSITALWLLLAFLLGSQSALGDVSALVDRNNLSIEETLTLKIRQSMDRNTQPPDLEDLRKNFEILRQAQGSQYRSFNGKVESWMEYTLTLAPKKEGTLLVPSFKVGSEFTDPIEITVTPAQPVDLTDGQPRDIFLETVVDSESVFVQQQLLLSIRLNTSLPVASIDRDELKLDNAKVELVAEDRFERTLAGRRYDVVELVFAVYPQQSGELVIPSMTWAATIGSRSSSLFDLYAKQSSLRRLRTSEQVITVQPKPVSYSGGTWLPAKNINLSESFSSGFPDYEQGEPIVRTITIQADSLTASQLPSLMIDYPDTINHYPEAPKIEEIKSRDGIVTQVTLKQTLLATSPGTYTLPPVELPWWNTTQSDEDLASLPSRTLRVAAVAGAQPADLVVPNPGESLKSASFDSQNSQASEEISNITNPGLGLPMLLVSNLGTAALVALLCWIIFGRKVKRPTETATSEHKPAARSHKQLLKLLDAAAKRQDYRKVHDLLFEWSKSTWPESATPLVTLKSECAGSPAQMVIAQIEARAFGRQANGTIDLQPLVQWLQAPKKPRNTSPALNQLAPLNP
jgi:hypothetical protein